MKPFLRAIKVVGVALLLGNVSCKVANSADSTPPSSEISAPRWIDLDADLSAVTDLRFRGVSYSNNGPAIYAYLQAQFGQWLYATIFTSTVDFPARFGLNDPDAKFNFWGGLKHQWDAFGLEAGAMYYYYPGQNISPGGRSYDYLEYFVNTSYSFGTVGSIAASVNWTDNWLNTGADATYVSIAPQLNLDPFIHTGLNAYVSGSFGALRYTPSDYFTNPVDYQDWSLGGGIKIKNTTFDLRYVDTSLSQSECRIDDGHEKWCGATVIGRISFDYSTR